MEVLCTQLNLQTLIVIGVILILVLVFEINLFSAFKKWLNYKHEELELKQYDIDIHLDVTSNIEERKDIDNSSLYFDEIKEKQNEKNLLNIFSNNNLQNNNESNKNNISENDNSREEDNKTTDHKIYFLK